MEQASRFRWFQATFHYPDYGSKDDDYLTEMIVF